MRSISVNILLLGLGLAACGDAKNDSSRQSSAVEKSSASANSAQPIRAAGIYINDDAPIANSLDVTVNIFAPVGAAQMAITEADHSIGLVWEPVQLTKPYRFTSGGKRTLYGRFKDASGTMLGIFVDTIEIDLFGVVGDAFVINDGAKTASSRRLNLKINVPALAANMMISESDSFRNGTWVAAANQYVFEVGGMQVRNIYLKFKSAQGIESRTYTASIIVSPFADDAASLVINGGASTSTSANLTLTIKVPTNAVSMKVFGATDELTAAWESPRTSRGYTAATGGLLTLNLKFRDAENNESQAWTTKITVDLFPVANLNFAVSFTNQAPSLRANLTSIQGTSYAQQMMISGRPTFKNATWVAFAPTATVSLDFCESTTILYIRFRDASGYVSEPIERSAAATCAGIQPISCNVKAEDLYLLNIAPKTEGNCLSCHAGNGNRIRFTAGDHSANRTAILTFTGATAQRFIDKMSGATSHGGGIQDLPASKIQPWFNQEKMCGN